MQYLNCIIMNYIAILMSVKNNRNITFWSYCAALLLIIYYAMDCLVYYHTIFNDVETKIKTREMSCNAPCLHSPDKCDFCGCLMKNSAFNYYIYIIYYHKDFYHLKPNFSHSTHLQVSGWAALLGSDPLPWHVIGWGCFFVLNYF